MAKCPNLVKITDGNFAGHADLDGPSLSNSTATELSMGFPFLSVQTGLAKAYPNVNHLIIDERETGPILCDAGDSIVGCKCTEPAEYIRQAIGGKMLGVKKLTLKLKLPSETSDGQWRKDWPKMTLQVLLALLPDLEVLVLHIDPPYTRDPTEACMLVRQVVVAITPFLLKYISFSTPYLQF